MKNKKAQLKIQAGKNQRFLVPKFSKGQLKIQEMAFMLVGVVMFFVLVGLFVVVLVYNNMHKNATDVAEQEAYTSVLRLAETAEFTCGNSKPNCIDADKLIVLTRKSEEYKKFWSKFSSIRVISESGLNKTKNLVECNLGNYPNINEKSIDCDMFVVFDRHKLETTKSVFVSLCRKSFENNYYYDKCEIAKLEIGFEQK
ncbi:MAG: hypothetical protein WC438_00885 [Candidatus Pacearchaeota archaeon]